MASSYLRQLELARQLKEAEKAAKRKAEEEKKARERQEKGGA